MGMNTETFEIGDAATAITAQFGDLATAIPAVVAATVSIGLAIWAVGYFKRKGKTLAN